MSGTQAPFKHLQLAHLAKGIRSLLLKHLPKVLIFLVLVACINSSVQATVVKDLSQRWLVFDEQTGTMVPYIPEVHPRTKILYLQFNPKLYGQYKLTLHIPDGSDVFINKQLVSAGTPNVLVYPLERETAKLMTVAVMHRKGFRDMLPEAQITSDATPGPRFEAKDPWPLRPLEADNNHYYDRLLLMGFALLGVLALYYNAYDFKFGSMLYSSVIGYFGRSKDEVERHGLFFYINFTLMYALVLTFYLQTMGLMSSAEETLINFTDNDVQGVLLVLLGSWAFITVKLLIALSVSKLNNLRSDFTLYLHEYVQATRLFLGVLLLLGLMVLLLGTGQTKELLRNFLVISIAVKTLVVVIRVYHKSTLKDFQLFSYFCATEIIPYAFILRVFY